MTVKRIISGEVLKYRNGLRINGLLRNALCRRKLICSDSASVSIFRLYQHKAQTTYHQRDERYADQCLVPTNISSQATYKWTRG